MSVLGGKRVIELGAPEDHWNIDSSVCPAKQQREFERMKVLVKRESKEKGEGSHRVESTHSKYEEGHIYCQPAMGSESGCLCTNHVILCSHLSSNHPPQLQLPRHRLDASL